MKKIALLICNALSAVSINAQSYNNDGDTIFGSSVIHSIYFNFYHSAYYDSLESSYTLDRYYTCNMIIDGHSYDSIGIKFKGNSSYNNQSQKKSMKIDLDFNIDGQDVDDLNKFNLNNGFKDPTFMREKIMCDFMNKNNIPAPRVTYAKVYYNNQYWGFFTFVEEVNSDFNDDRFNDKAGNLFKGDPNGDLKWINSTPSSYYNKYELKTNETQNDWTDLVQLINAINNTPINTLRSTLDNYLNTTEFLRAWAASNIFANLDSYLGSGHNYYIYHDSIVNKFQYITIDVNECFGVFTQQMNISQLEALSPFYLGTPNTNRPLCNNLLQDAASKQELTYWFCTLLQPDQFSNANLDPIIDSLANRIRTDVYADPNKFFTNQQFEDNQSMNITSQGNYPGLKSFITNRRNSLMNSLAPFGCYLSTNDNALDSYFSIFPNPATDNITLKFETTEERINVKIIDLLGNIVFEQNAENTNQLNINTSYLSSGLYSIAINNTSFKKLEVIR